MADPETPGPPYPPTDLADRLYMIGVNHPTGRATILGEQAVNIVLRYIDAHSGPGLEGAIEVMTELGIRGTRNRMVWLTLLGEKRVYDDISWDGPDQPEPEMLRLAEEVAEGLLVSLGTAISWLEGAERLVRYDKGGTIPVGPTRAENPTDEAEPVQRLQVGERVIRRDEINGL
ncbi:MAG TPA: hypothetical protein VHK88_20125 [Aquihabitans sp.]|jgi:hypothetical protein|nr:hypothetical protein [Aquihabitans sp.]